MAAVRAAIRTTGGTTSLFGNDLQTNPNTFPSLTDQTKGSRPYLKNHRISSPLRDRNAKMRAPSKAAPVTNSPNGKMTHYDKQHSSSKPLAPTLTASSKPSNRQPLTPRLVSSRTSYLTRQVPLPVAVTSRPREGKVTPPVSEFINNIASRPGSRTSRINSTSPSPTNTKFSGTQNLKCVGGLGEFNHESLGKTSVSIVPSAHSRKSSYSSEAEKSSKFFFANELKTSVSHQQQQPQVQAKNPSTYSFANLDLKYPQREYSYLSPVSSPISEEKLHPVFFHANGTPDLSSLGDESFTSQSCASSICQTQVIATKFVGNKSPTTPLPASQTRSPSPTIHNQHVSPPPLESDNSSSRLAISNKGYHTVDTIIEESSTHFIAESLATDLGGTHLHGEMSVEQHSEDIDETKMVEILSNSDNTPLNTFSKPGTAGEAAQPKESQSPIRIRDTQEQKNDPATNARRDRKILDLEITNSSLTAINRALEREMRKQTVELRRFKRLSRLDCLSLNQFSSLDALSGGEENNGVQSLEICNNEDLDDELAATDEEHEISDIGFSKDKSVSLEAVGLNDQRYRTNDERRLQLDLARHQQVLTGSQKMNQTLKRCLGLTDEMIKEGMKALQNTVGAEDIELGGRVLAQDDIECNENEGMSEVGLKILKEVRETALIERRAKLISSKHSIETEGCIIDPHSSSSTEGVRDY